MTCEEALERLLEADPEVLGGIESGDLAAHLASCPGCRARARRVLQGEAALDAALASLTEARASRFATAAPARWWPPRWGLAAAAAVAAIVVGTWWRQPPVVTAPPELVRAEPPVDVDVSPAADRSAVVFRTADPSITVIWFF